MSKTNRKTHKVTDIFPRSSIEDFIKLGQISRKGAWYQINDLEVLNYDFSGMIKKISITKQETLIQLYS